MEAPLGASALMHSSTLVIAGLVLIYRLINILEFSSYAQILMYLMGVFSAFCGSIIACFQFELKVVMAYSTISNMGYMFVLCALGAYFEMLIVIIIHAYIKIFLFLVMGGIILHCNGCQDVRWMGGLFMYIPVLLVSYFVGGICLIGLPY
jgi:NADH:ubiquinone oxidoreductase subunit 5 (subunit L)/multisubunit Na+/H+ antiporter MnhA subunit